MSTAKSMDIEMLIGLTPVTRVASLWNMSNQSPIRYVQITTVDGDKFIIRVTRDTAKVVMGIEVDRDGDEVVPSGSDASGRAYDERMRVVPRDGIKKMVEMRMNVMYGRIERAR